MTPASSAGRYARTALALSSLVLVGCDDKDLTNLDREPPVVAITSPAADDFVSGVSFIVDIDATDDSEVAFVEVDVNGVRSSIDTTEPYRVLIFSIASQPDDPMLVTARAFDTSGNSSSESITVTVSDRTVTRLTDWPNDDMNPSWSPDGTAIVFQSRRPEGHFDIWTMAEDGSNLTRLTSNTNEDRNPAWSPSGDMIAFDSNRAGSYDIWTLPLAGGEAEADSLTFGNLDNIEPAWTPDASMLYFASNRGDNAPFNIWSVPSGGGVQTQVTSFLEPDTSPAVSPDGLFLAFASSLNFESARIYTMLIGSEEVTPLTGNDLGFAEQDPFWAPTSNALIYNRISGSTRSNVWGVPLEGGAPTQVTFGSSTFGDGGAVFSPDASRIAFHSDRDGNLEIYVLE